MSNSFYKILNADMKHHGFQYKIGMNIDVVPFNPEGSCENGGLYYTNKENITRFLKYGCLLADVEIPEGARTYAEPDGTKWKSDKLFIRSVCSITDSKWWDDYNFCLNAVQQDGLALQYVKEQTPEICLIAVQQNGRALEYIKEQTPEICLKAVKQNGYALQFVKEQTPELCLIAVQQNGWALKYVKNQTHEICLVAVQQNELASICIEDTSENYLVLVKKNEYAHQYRKMR